MSNLYPTVAHKAYVKPGDLCYIRTDGAYYYVSRQGPRKYEVASSALSNEEIGIEALDLVLVVDVGAVVMRGPHREFLMKNQAISLFGRTMIAIDPGYLILSRKSGVEYKNV